VRLERLAVRKKLVWLDAVNVRELVRHYARLLEAKSRIYALDGAKESVGAGVKCKFES
jgi:hypothetical protein